MNSAVKTKADQKFREAYDVCYLPLIKYCSVRIGDTGAAADDCVQEAFLVYYNKLLSGEDIKNPRAFLYRTADNFVRRARENYRRELKTTVPLDLAEDIPTERSPFVFENPDYDLLAQRLLKTLTADEQNLYKLKYIDNLPLAQIAELLNITPAAAAKRTSRLRQNIKEKVTDFIDNTSEGGI